MLIFQLSNDRNFLGANDIKQFIGIKRGYNCSLTVTYWCDFKVNVNLLFGLHVSELILGVGHPNARGFKSEATFGQFNVQRIGKTDKYFGSS